MTIDLLVSVRDAEEACVAADAGVAIVDVKDPSNGPLGFAGATRIQSIQAAIPTADVSAALGELADWDAANFRLKAPLCFAKFGLAGLADRWRDRWQVATESLNHSVEQWVAVAYADFSAVDAPAPEDVLAQTASDAKVLLIDTFQKTGVNSIHHLGVSRLQTLRQMAQEYGMKLALAGQLCAADLDSVHDIRPDILAVRGAVCVGVDRRNRVDSQSVQDLQVRLKECCRSSL